MWFSASRNPVDKDGSTAAIVEEGRMHLQVSLIFAVAEKLPSGTASVLVQGGEDRMADWAAQVGEIAAQMRVAGGSLLSSRPPWLAHKASHEGVLCVEHIAGLPGHPLDPLRIPACTYSHPQVASVGMTEAQAQAAGKSVKVGKFPFAANGKAIAMGETAGFTKVVFDAGSGELLGAHMVGDEVTEMIQGFGIAQTLEATEADLMATIVAHPTMSESMHEAVLAAYGRALHL